MMTRSEVDRVMMTAASMVYGARRRGHEAWAAVVYLLVWSFLWLAVIVAVLAPLDALFQVSP